jgi:hypothetical protein
LRPPLLVGIAFLRVMAGTEHIWRPKLAALDLAQNGAMMQKALSATPEYMT